MIYNLPLRSQRVRKEAKRARSFGLDWRCPRWFFKSCMECLNCYHTIETASSSVDDLVASLRQEEKKREDLYTRNVHTHVSVRFRMYIINVRSFYCTKKWFFFAEINFLFSSSFLLLRWCCGAVAACRYFYTVFEKGWSCVKSLKIIFFYWKNFSIILVFTWAGCVLESLLWSLTHSFVVRACI